MTKTTFILANIVCMLKQERLQFIQVYIYIVLFVSSLLQPKLDSRDCVLYSENYLNYLVYMYLNSYANPYVLMNDVRMVRTLICFVLFVDQQKHIVQWYFLFSYLGTQVDTSKSDLSVMMSCVIYQSIQVQNRVCRITQITNITLKKFNLQHIYVFYNK